MRRADYLLVARGFRESRPIPNGDRATDWYRGWLEAVESVGDVLGEGNAAFDYQLWLHNCGVEPS